MISINGRQVTHIAYSLKFMAKRTLTAVLAGTFLLTNTLSWAGEERLFSTAIENKSFSSHPANNVKLSPALRTSAAEFKELYKTVAICRLIEKNGGIGDASSVKDVLAKLPDIKDKFGSAHFSVLPDEVIIEVPDEALAIRYFDPAKANIITPYSDISKLETKVINPRLNRQIIHRTKILQSPAPRPYTSLSASEKLAEAMAQTYNAIVFDIDGTLTNGDSEVPEEMVSRIAGLIDNGIYVVLVSGRAYTIPGETAKRGVHCMKEVADKIRLKVTDNSKLKHLLIFEQSGALGRNGFLENDARHERFDFGFKPLAMKTKREIYAKLVRKNGDRLFCQYDKSHCLTIFVKKEHRTPDTLQSLVAETEGILRLKGLNGFEVMASDVSIEIVYKGAQKDNAIKVLTEHFKIPEGKIASDGDRGGPLGNDRAIVERKGGFCVGDYFSPDSLQVSLPQAIGLRGMHASAWLIDNLRFEPAASSGSNGAESKSDTPAKDTPLTQSNSDSRPANMAHGKMKFNPSLHRIAIDAFKRTMNAMGFPADIVLSEGRTFGQDPKGYDETKRLSIAGLTELLYKLRLSGSDLQQIESNLTYVLWQLDELYQKSGNDLRAFLRRLETIDDKYGLKVIALEIMFDSKGGFINAGQRLKEGIGAAMHRSLKAYYDFPEIKDEDEVLTKAAGAAKIMRAGVSDEAVGEKLINSVCAKEEVRYYAAMGRAMAEMAHLDECISNSSDEKDIILNINRVKQKALNAIGRSGDENWLIIDRAHAILTKCYSNTKGHLSKLAAETAGSAMAIIGQAKVDAGLSAAFPIGMLDNDFPQDPPAVELFKPTIFRYNPVAEFVTNNIPEYIYLKKMVDGKAYVVEIFTNWFSGEASLRETKDINVGWEVHAYEAGSREKPGMRKGFGTLVLDENKKIKSLKEFSFSKSFWDKPTGLEPWLEEFVTSWFISQTGKLFTDANDDLTVLITERYEATRNPGLLFPTEFYPEDSGLLYGGIPGIIYLRTQQRKPQFTDILSEEELRILRKFAEESGEEGLFDLKNEIETYCVAFHFIRHEAIKGKKGEIEVDYDIFVDKAQVKGKLTNCEGSVLLRLDPEKKLIGSSMYLHNDTPEWVKKFLKDWLKSQINKPFTVENRDLAEPKASSENALKRISSDTPAPERGIPAKDTPQRTAAGNILQCDENYIILDMDGVILDTISINRRNAAITYCKIFNGISPEENAVFDNEALMAGVAFYDAHLGESTRRNIIEAIKYVRRENGALLPGDEDELAKRYHEEYQTRRDAEMKRTLEEDPDKLLLPGAREFIIDQHARGKKIFIASSTPAKEERLEVLRLTGIARYFEEIHIVPGLTEKINAIRNIITDLGVDAEEILYVDDASKVVAEVREELGDKIHIIGVPCDRANREKMLALGVKGCISNLGDLITIRPIGNAPKIGGDKSDALARVPMEDVASADKALEELAYGPVFDELKEMLLGYRQRLNTIKVDYKDHKEVVTEVDHKVQNKLIRKIFDLCPTHRVIAEEVLPGELSHINQSNKDSPFLWVIDPLDGTGQFMNPASKDYCVAVSLLFNGLPLASFILAPEFEYKDKGGILFVAIRGKGVFINGEPLVPERRQDLRSAIVYSELPESEHEYLLPKYQYDAISDKFRTVKTAPTSTTLDILRVFLGESELFIHPRPKLWDALPAATIVELTGGAVFYPDGNNVFSVDPSISNQSPPQRLPGPLALTYSREIKDFIIGLGINRSAPENGAPAKDKSLNPATGSYIEYLNKNETLFKDMLDENMPNTLIRVPVEAIESLGIDNIKNFLEIFQRASNGYVELYYMSGIGEVDEAVYQKYGLTKKRLPEDLKNPRGRTRANTVTLFATLKGHEVDEAYVKSRLGSFDMNPKNTILVPIGLQHDQAGLVKATILGLKIMDVARQLTANPALAKDQAFKDDVQTRILQDLLLLYRVEDLKGLGPEDIIALASSTNIIKLINSLKKLIDLLPITPIDAEELRQIYEHAKAVITAA